jgi:hypothetical protein
MGAGKLDLGSTTRMPLFLQHAEIEVLSVMPVIWILSVMPVTPGSS